jgi:predicted DsbA family dithiol-disulfide isomerase
MERSGPPRLYFDYVDPISYLVEVELAAATGAGDLTEPERIPLELRPPPAPLLDPEAPWWRERWQAAVAAGGSGGGVALAEPSILPWTRKAHELVAHARAAGVGPQAHRAVFEAMFGRGEDIGRIDVLVGIAETLGLDPTETKAVLDVDRYAQDVAALSAEAASSVGEPPALSFGGRVLRGFHNRDALRTFLLR